MPDRVIRNGRVEIDRWRFVGDDPLPQPLPQGRGESSAPLPRERGERAPLPWGRGWGEGPVVVSLSAWKAHREALLARGAPLGVWLAPEDDPAELEADLAALELVAVHFPKFTDGRGYSTAALLRKRHGYRGELRAFGDVGRDQLFYLARCGFDSFALPAQRDAQAALAAFGDFTVRYQGAIDDPVPLFRRRSAGIAR